MTARTNVELIGHMVGREFRLRYRRSLLGWLWAVIMPLARLIVLAFVFTQIIPLDVDNYTSYLYTGLLAWIWFSAGVASATSSVVDRSDLLTWPGVPRATLPLTAVIGDAIDYLVALPLLVGWLAFEVGVGVTALAMIPLLAAQLLMMLGIGYVLAPAHVYLRNVSRVVDLALLIGFYVTPVFYAADSLPENLAWMVEANPIARLLEAQRTALVDHRWPSAATVLFLVGLGVAVALAGRAVFARYSARLVDEL